MKIILPQKFVTNAHFCVLYYGDLNALQIVTSYNSSQYYSLEQVKYLDFFHQNFLQIYCFVWLLSHQRSEYPKLYRVEWLVKTELTRIWNEDVMAQFSTVPAFSWRHQRKSQHVPLTEHQQMCYDLEYLVPYILISPNMALKFALNQSNIITWSCSLCRFLHSSVNKGKILTEL
jgi:hypothetical protein